MKICFLLQRRFAYIAHDTAWWLQKKYGVKDFCGYVYLRWSFDFLKSQHNIVYHNLLLDEDIHKEYLNEPLDTAYLAQLERDYGLPNLWPYIALDRVLMFNSVVREYPYDASKYTHEEMMRIFQVKARALLKFLDTEKPDAVVFPNIGGISALLLYIIAKKRGIKPLVILPACTKNRYVLSEKYDYFTGVDEMFAKYRNDLNPPGYAEAKEFLESFRNKPRSFRGDDIEKMGDSMSRRHYFRFLKPTNLSRSVSWYAEVIKHYFEDRKYNDYSNDMNPWYYLVDRFKRKLRNLRGASDLYDPVDSTEDFAFFPLHLEPEVATLLQAPFFTNQLTLIAQVARSLPVHFKLYVKEHPFMVEYRPRWYYQQLKKIPNVKLINPAVVGLRLIKEAKLITTITSTAAWEGVFLKKPVITFGDQFYNRLSMIKKCRIIEDLPTLVQDCLNNYTYDEEELLHFIAAILTDSIPLPMVYLWEQETDPTKKRAGVEPLADLLAKKLELKPV